MKHASIAPSLDADIHLVLCRFGRAGLAYVETDSAEADATTVIQNLLYGRYGEPLSTGYGTTHAQSSWWPAPSAIGRQRTAATN